MRDEGGEALVLLGEQTRLVHGHGPWQQTQASENPEADHELAASPAIHTNDAVVPPQPWIRVALIFITAAFGLPTFLTGIDVFQALVVGGNTDNTNPWRSAITAILAGNVLLAVVGSTCGAIGARTHLSSYALADVAFGTNGAAIFNLAFCLSLLGWFGVNLNMFSDCILRLLEHEEEEATPRTIRISSRNTSILVEFLGGITMTWTTLHGLKAFEALSLMLVPVLAIVTALLIYKSVAALTTATTTSTTMWMTTSGANSTRTATVEHSSSLSSSLEDADEMSFGQAISSVVGLSIVGAIIMPDYTRFLSTWYGSVYSACLAYVVIQSVVEVAGGMASVAFDNDNFLDIMVTIGLRWEAFAIVIAGSWVINAMNLYSAVLSVQATFPNLDSRACVGALGLLGTLAAFAHILDSLLSFLFYLSIVFAPVAGVVATDYLFLRRNVYDTFVLSALEQRPSVAPLSLLAWAVGAVFAGLGSINLIRLTGIAALDAFSVAALSYLCLSLCRAFL